MGKKADFLWPAILENFEVVLGEVRHQLFALIPNGKVNRNQVYVRPEVGLLRRGTCELHHTANQRTHKGNHCHEEG
jgi:hypothetical protein